MFLRSLASAFPDASYTQKECWEALCRHRGRGALRDRSVKLLERVLLGDSGIDRRHFALGEPEGIFAMNAQKLNEAFEVHAPALAVRALSKALGQAGLLPGELDALFVCTCTGYLCPGVSSHVAERLGLRSDAYLQDLVGLGCGAAIPLLRSADGFLRTSGGELRVATVSVEVCSACFYLDDDPGVLVSLCLFGDGASASIWQSTPREGAWQAGAFQTVHHPERREDIRFVNAGGYLRNQLSREVPALAASAVGSLFERVDGEVDGVLCHSGGREILKALEATFPGESLAEEKAILRRYGNVSSPSVMLALESRLMEYAEDERLWMTSFGAGFSAHSCELRRWRGESR